jgi:cytoskeletal protein CcmA (bactofilin family)
MAKNTEVDPNAINQIVEGTLIKGDIISERSTRIVGALEGNLTTKGRLVIGKSGKITGTVFCDEADIEGTINGKLITQGLLSLRPTAVLNCETYARQLMVEPGAVLNGMLDMSGVNMPVSEAFKNQPDENKKEKSAK